MKSVKKNKVFFVTAITVAFLTISLLSVIYIQLNYVSYCKVRVNGVEVGDIKCELELHRFLAEQTQKYKNKHKNDSIYIDTTAIIVEPKRHYKKIVHSKQTFAKLEKIIKPSVKAVQIKVNGKCFGVLSDKLTAVALINRVKRHYCSKQTMIHHLFTPVVWIDQKKPLLCQDNPQTMLESIKIKEKITFEPACVTPEKLSSTQTLFDLFTKGDKSRHYYTVKMGDTIRSIANKYGTTQAEFTKNNPNLKEKSMEIGQKITLILSRTPVTVRTIESLVKQIVIQPNVQTRNSSELKAGVRKTIRLGRKGLTRVKYQLIKQNGKMVRKICLEKQTIKPAQTKLVLVGTKVFGEGSGKFIYPVYNASITSNYGKRGRSFHKGVDLIGSSKIVAADEGVVVFTGAKKSFGNLVIINHKNGFKTLYAHLKNYNVALGQVVKKGQTIGLMGNTGNATGRHLHFEIHFCGVCQNPMKYLKY